MPLDRARAEEQFGANLRVGAPVRSKSGDLRLLRGELTASLVRTFANRLARCEQFATGALGKPLGSDVAERVVGGSKLVARVDAPVFATEPFPVEQAGPGEV